MVLPVGTYRQPENRNFTDLPPTECLSPLALSEGEPARSPQSDPPLDSTPSPETHMDPILATGLLKTGSRILSGMFSSKGPGAAKPGAFAERLDESTAGQRIQSWIKALGINDLEGLRERLTQLAAEFRSHSAVAERLPESGTAFELRPLSADQIEVELDGGSRFLLGRRTEAGRLAELLYTLSAVERAASERPGSSLETLGRQAARNLHGNATR